MTYLNQKVKFQRNYRPNTDLSINISKERQKLSLTVCNNIMIIYLEKWLVMWLIVKLKMYKSVGFCSMSIRKELIKMISFLAQYQMPETSSK